MAPEWTPIRNGRWEAMDATRRREFLAGLRPSQQLAQARARAAATGRDVAHVLRLWGLNGYITHERLAQLLGDLERIV